MVNLIIAPSLDRELVQQRTVVTMDGLMADFKAPPFGIAIDDIPQENRRIQIWFRAQAQHALDRMAVRGYEYWDHDDIHVYGPYPSRLLHENIRSLKDFNLDVQGAADLVRQPPKGIEAFADYWLVANFVKQPVPMDEEALGHAELPKELMA